MNIDKYRDDVLRAIESAEERHPSFPVSFVRMASILTEESGEVCREANKLEDDHNGSVESFRIEIMHTICVCYRMLEKLDKSGVTR